MLKTTSSAPPKLAHIFQAQKQRYLLEIVFAKLLSRGNRTRQGFSRFDIIHFGPSDDVLGLRIDFVLCFIKCAVKRGSLFVAAAKILCKSHCTGYYLRCGRVLRTPRVILIFYFLAENCRSFIHRLMICGLHDDAQIKTFLYFHGGPSFDFASYLCEA